MHSRNNKQTKALGGTRQSEETLSSVLMPYCKHLSHRLWGCALSTKSEKIVSTMIISIYCTLYNVEIRSRGFIHQPLRKMISLIRKFGNLEAICQLPIFHFQVLTGTMCDSQIYFWNFVHAHNLNLKIFQLSKLKHSSYY